MVGEIKKHRQGVVGCAGRKKIPSGTPVASGLLVAVPCPGDRCGGSGRGRGPAPQVAAVEPRVVHGERSGGVREALWLGACQGKRPTPRGLRRRLLPANHRFPVGNCVEWTGVRQEGNASFEGADVLLCGSHLGLQAVDGQCQSNRHHQSCCRDECDEADGKRAHFVHSTNLFQGRRSRWLTEAGCTCKRLNSYNYFIIAHTLNIVNNYRAAPEDLYPVNPCAPRVAGEEV